MKKVILFDLDGTIIDSQEGVTKCVQYALEHFGIVEQDLEKLRVFIGPPLRGQFRKIYGMSETQAEQAVKKYRERYVVKGMYECRLYPYVREILQHLREKGYILALASSKTESACVGILEYFGIKSLFDLIGGATEDGRISQKAEVLQMVLERLALPDAADYLLIGDTRFDALGAKAVGMDCLGVTYGFGTHTELDQAGVVGICGSLPEAEQFLERWDSSVLAEKAGTKERLTQAD